MMTLGAFKDYLTLRYISITVYYVSHSNLGSKKKGSFYFLSQASYRKMGRKSMWLVFKCYGLA